MGFFTLLEVATMPVLQVLIISILGAFMATNYCNLLTADARRQLNKIVFVVFTPSLMFASLAKTVTFQDIISWWFMPINIGLVFLIGGSLGWVVVKILKPEPHLEGLLIATCSAGNLGNLMLIVVPAICNEKGSPFGDQNLCNSTGLSYASFSMANFRRKKLHGSLPLMSTETGLRSARLKPMVIMGVIVVRYVILPVIGMGVVKAAGDFGLLPADPLFRYVLMLQFTLPPAMNIGTMTQLFDVGQEECSILFLWTYLVASLAITLWSTVYMYTLS
ncbi:hypothetical protein MKW94_012096 [Papaver nudicaule]|uniref:Auxin efflux carrier n=1 Tax=Papaver nudicaule TaxID=74823 RepID=A0AA41S3L2_PAPNU|nr:hypothetical protein [Papaver nudicaule]